VKSPSAAERLERLLSESLSAAQARESQAFDLAAAPFRQRVVIYGAGNLGRRILRALRANGADALAFADRNPASWSRTIDGLSVLSPEDAARRYGADALFLIGIWNSTVAGGLHGIAQDLTAMGCRGVAPFTYLSWKYPTELLPNYLWDLPSRLIDAAAGVQSAFDLLQGARSRAEFVRQVEFRLTSNFGCLLPPDSDPQYFPNRRFRPQPDEFLVDCGAYNGDTLLDFARWTGGAFQGALAFEADPQNFADLQRTIAGHEQLAGRVRALPQAVSAERCTVHFEASGLTSAAISDTGGIEVQCVPIDEVIDGDRPTYIKMDIEGAEPDALRGAAGVLRTHRPALAICAYHLQEHLWQIPLLIDELMPGSRLLLGAHCPDGFELVYYAITPGREVDLALEDEDG